MVDEVGVLPADILPLLTRVPVVAPILSLDRSHAVGSRVERDASDVGEEDVGQVVFIDGVVLDRLGERDSSTEVENQDHYHKGKEGSMGSHLECWVLDRFIMCSGASVVSNDKMRDNSRLFRNLEVRERHT